MSNGSGWYGFIEAILTSRTDVSLDLYTYQSKIYAWLKIMILKKITQCGNSVFPYNTTSELEVRSLYHSENLIMSLCMTFWAFGFEAIDNDRGDKKTELQTPVNTGLLLRETRPNSVLDLRRRCTSVCKQSICKVQIFRNEIRLHPNYTML